MNALTPLATRYAIVDPRDITLVDEWFDDLRALYKTMSLCSSRNHARLAVYEFDFIRGTLTDITVKAMSDWWDFCGSADEDKEDPTVFYEMMKRTPVAAFREANAMKEAV